jgi:hypothetical protein
VFAFGQMRTQPLTDQRGAGYDTILAMPRAVFGLESVAALM